MHLIQKSVGELLGGPPPATLRREDTVATAMAALKHTGRTAVLICDEGRLTGIFTERDLFNRIRDPSFNPTTMPLGEVMSREPRCLREHDCVTWAIHRMAMGGYANIPVIDDDGRPVGMLDVRNIMRHLDEIFDELTRNDTDADVLPLPEWVDTGGGG